MAKKIKFERYRYRLLSAAHASHWQPAAGHDLGWQDFVAGLNFSYERGAMLIAWQRPHAGTLTLALDEPRFCRRGDTAKDVAEQGHAGLDSGEDTIKLHNAACFAAAVAQLAQAAGYIQGEGADAHAARIRNERDFHDAWAGSADINAIDVRASNEVCTAPEMRHITRRLGDISGKRLLDVGCGLGEASVYFALLGAEVTSSDLSQGMLDATSQLAQRNGVSVHQHIASAEDMQLGAEQRFDIIYAGNLLHHVDIEATLTRIKPHLAPGGVFVSWDPLHYNPAINIYRRMATDVRTPDEHPLKWSDIRLFHRHFSHVETRYFWLTTLIIFVLMALAQRRNPNQERFWKVVVQEGDNWAWLYRPLAALDRLLLAVCPPLRLLCWNVVIISRQ